ncbi:MAG TPA: hypothetical protein VLK27_04980 [Chthoniobacterales bacterium]|nr:hypothetical protein [Chthoniobacterales bacterium]
MPLLKSILSNDLGVAENYGHGKKKATPGALMETAGAVLKWYALAPANRPVPNEIDRLARTYLTKVQLGAKGFGFVILHRCGNDFYFLIVSTWRGNNELWETVFYKNGDAMKDFDLWPREEMHKPTFCVWELAPVWHETKSWERFLASTRDENAARVWLNDLYAGEA